MVLLICGLYVIYSITMSMKIYVQEHEDVKGQELVYLDCGGTDNY